MNQLLSVIIPVYNHAAGLKQSLFSLSRQSYRPLETIIVNDGSTDDLKVVLKDLEKESWWHDINVKVLDQANCGASAARNAGFQESKGELIIFWDADTIARPDMLEKMAATLALNQEASYVYCQYRFGFKKMKSRVFSGEELRKMNYIDTTSMLRRSAVVAFDESLKRFQDWDLWLSLLEKGKTGVFIPEVLFKKLVRGRKGYSTWLPRFMYRLPFKTSAVINYEAARKQVAQKHHLG